MLFSDIYLVRLDLMLETTSGWNIVNSLGLSVCATISTRKNQVILGALVCRSPFTLEALVWLSRLIPLQCPFWIAELPCDIHGLWCIVNAIWVCLTCGLDRNWG